MIGFRIAAPLALIAALSAPALAGETIYECTLSSGTESGWLTSPVIIVHKDGEAEAKAADPVIQSVYGKPLTVKLKEENNAKITFGWLVKSQDVESQNISMTYRATILKGSNKFVMAGIPTGYANTFRGEGKCKVSRKG